MTASRATTSAWLGQPLHTDRLVLRAVTAEDVPAIRPLWTDVRVRRYLGGPVPGRRERYAVDEPGRFTVARRADGTVVGMVLLCRYERTGDTEVAYLFLPEHWGHGYAREAVDAVLRYGFAGGGPERIVAVTQEANAPSRRLLEDLGMTAREAFVEHGATQVLYALDRAAHGRHPETRKPVVPPK